MIAGTLSGGLRRGLCGPRLERKVLEMKTIRADFALRLSLIYALFAGVWIVASDLVLALVTGDDVQAGQTVKGLVFISTTALLLFVLVRRERAVQDAVTRENARLYAEKERYAAELEQRVALRTDELNRAKENVEAILNSSTDVIILAHTDGTILQVNPMFEQLFGCTIQEAQGQPLSSLCQTAEVDRMKAVLATVVTQQEPARLEVVAQCHGGPTFEADAALSPVVREDGQTVGIVCSLRDMTTGKELERQLQRATEEQVRLSHARSRFASMASHELRTPLAVIQASASLLANYYDRLSEEDRQKRFGRIQSNVIHMTELLDRVLTISQAEAGMLRFAPAQGDLAELCQQIAAEIQRMTDTAHSIAQTVSGTCADVWYDERLVRHIVQNLLTNAIKYSPDGSPVTFDLACENEHVTIRVRDEGIGIPQADQAHIFEPFHRARNVEKRPGSGLGLAIVRQSVELHGGTIDVTSAEGQGTTFDVCLPVGPPATG